VSHHPYFWLVVAMLFVFWGGPQQAGQTSANEELWEAARAGDVARVQKALDSGADVNAKARYDMTALAFAADKGHTDVVRLLLDRGAQVNSQDTFYKMRAVDLALQNGHRGVARLLLERGSQGAPAALMNGLQADDAALVKLALASPDLTAANLNSALAMAKKLGRSDAVTAITEKLAALPAAAAPKVTIERPVLESYAGTYRTEGGMTLTVGLSGDTLTVTVPGQPALTLVPASTSSFTVVEVDGLSVSFAGRGGMTERMTVVQNNNTTVLQRVTADAAAAKPSATATAPPAPTPSTAAPPAPARRTAARPWPAFRGQNAAGNGDGQGAVSEWNVATGTNVRWKTPVPGIAISSPIVWGDRVFVTTAVGSSADKTFRTGLYGDVKPVDDLSEHTWKMVCLDKATGKVLWERTAFTGTPKVKRHPKSTQANSTPVTDGKRVVAVFGSIGLLAAWDINGAPLWTQKIGVIDSGWFLDPTYQWGHSSSPIIYRNSVILQADAQKGSYVAAYDLSSGKELWRTPREEIPTWGTPTVFSANGRDELVTNGTKVRGYDPQTGKQLWTLGPNSEVTVGTPVVGDGLVYVTGGYPPVRPVYAIKPGSNGDISLAKGATSSEAIAWSNTSGTYIPTPIVYDGLLYTLDNSGILTTYDAKSGERIYRSRVGGGGAFTASPVAADGRLFIANEDGDVFVVRAGRTYEQLAKNEMKEVILSTPAISDGLIIVRTLGHVYAFGEK
jgi:hypothetical protein